MVLVATLATASAAYAKKNPPAPPPPPPPPTVGSTLCKMSDITVDGATPSGAGATCIGWYSGNLNGGSDAMNTESAYALNQMLGVTTYTAAFFSDLHNFAASGPVVDFSTALYGETIVSFHVGAAKGAGGVGYESTAFYEFNAGDLVGGLTSLTFNLPGLSNVELIKTGSYVPPPPPPCVTGCGSGGGIVPGIPEPAAWALMILGFGGAGAMLRRRRAIAA